MKNTKKVIAGIAALSLVMSMTACGNKAENGGSSGGEGNSADETTIATTTQVTVAVNTEGLKEEEEDVLEDTMSKLKDVELENKVVKWLGNYDLNPSTTGESKSVALEMFERKYGGSIKYYPVPSWQQRYDYLGQQIVGGEGIDLFPGNDPNAFPSGIIKGRFQPVNDYIDLNDPLWQTNISGMEAMKFGDGYYEFVTATVTQYMCYYDKSTIEAFGLEDPWDLYEAGEWNWDKFKEMLLEYVDPDSDQYGLDGWYNEQTLFLSAGVPFVGKDASGNIVCNVNDATVEKAMNFQYDLFQSGLVLDQEQFGWQPQFNFLGEGKELFYLGGRWEIQGDPKTWSSTVDPENIGFVPIPSPAGSDPYQFVNFEGYLLCKDAGNPEAAARFVECELLAKSDENAIAISNRKALDDNHWTQEIIDKRAEIDELGRKYPVYELASGCSTDIASVTTDGGAQIGLRAAFHGYDWATNRESIADVLTRAVGEVNDDLQKALKG